MFCPWRWGPGSFWPGSPRDFSLRADMDPRFEAYAALLKEWNRRFNLVSAGDLPKIGERHFEDSLKFRGLFPGLPFERAIDVGSGAGFPGLPLALEFPGKRFDLLESVGKKCTSLRTAATELGLRNVQVLNGRSEVLAREAGHRETYDLGVARALDRPAAALELVLPLVRTGGACVFWAAGEDWKDRSLLNRVAHRLGGEIAEEKAYVLGEDSRIRKLVLVQKRSPTPEEFPRRAGIPGKNPLK